MQDKDYISINKASWDKKTEAHLGSDFYDMKSFLEGKSSLKEIELPLLGDINGKSILHLQCHFGQDTISLARMGAEATGADFSGKAIESAIELAGRMKANASFVCCDIYDLPKHIDRKFDIVFTSYGTIGWLPDLDRWAKVISGFLKPGGKFIFAEFHPVVWMFDDKFGSIAYNYFGGKPIIETEQGTYADKNADITVQTVSWNHPLSEVFTSLMDNGIELREFREYDYSPYNCFSNMEEFEKGKFRIPHLKNDIPMVYSLVAIRTK